MALTLDELNATTQDIVEVVTSDIKTVRILLIGKLQGLGTRHEGVIALLDKKQVNNF